MKTSATKTTMSDAENDTALLEGLKSSDSLTRRNAEHALFERFRVPVEQLMRRMLGDDLDDCVQEAFVDVYRGLASFEGRSKLSTWVYRVALRRAWKCVAHRRRDARGHDDAARVERSLTRGSAADVPDQLAGEELARRFGAALLRLDLDQRTVMALSALDGLGPAEIAAILGVPSGTVHSRMSRARARLRALLGLAE